MSDAAKKTQDNEKLSTALNEIFSNPQMLSAISSMAQNLKSADSSSTPAQEKSSPPSDTSSTAQVAEKLPELLNMLSSNNTTVKQTHKNELLCALKPYLSQNRSDAIDKIIRFSELSNVFKNLS